MAQAARGGSPHPPRDSADGTGTEGGIDEARDLAGDVADVAFRVRQALELPRVGGDGSPKNASVGASSISWPAYITTILSQISWAVPRSWVVKRTETPCSLTRREAGRGSGSTVTSSGRLVGDDRSGRGRSAAATGRCRCPPLSWCDGEHLLGIVDLTAEQIDDGLAVAR
jgi:hypothetical protein